MTRFFTRGVSHLLLGALFIVAWSVPAVRAQTGTFSSRTLTFADKSAATLSVTAKGLLFQGTTTRIWLQFGSDNVNSALPASAVSSVSFTLSKGATNLAFTIADVGKDDSSTFADKRIQFNAEDASKLLYKLEITHLTQVDLNTTETWTLAMSNLPATGSSPPQRAIVFLEQASFASLTPTGVCGGQCPPCPRECPDDQCCTCGPCGIAKFPWWKYAKSVVDIHFPFPPPCLSCPPEWNTPIPEGVDRVMVSAAPYIKEGEPLGPGKADQIRLSIKGGQPIGGVVDVGQGQYMQLIQYRKGAAPRVSASAAGITSQEVFVGPEPSKAGHTYKTLTYLLALLLLAAVAVIVRLMRHRSGPAGGMTRG